MVIFALVVVAFNNQEVAIEVAVEAVLLEAFQVPLKISIDKANALIEIDTSGMVDRAIKAITMGVQISVFELQVMAGILKHKVLARSKMECKYRFSQRIKRTHVLNWDEEKYELEEYDFLIEDVETELATEWDEAAENIALALAADAELSVLSKSAADALTTSIFLLEEALTII